MSNFSDEKFGNRDILEEKWRMPKEPDFEKLEEILNAQSQETRILAEMAEKGSTSIEGFAEIGRKTSRTIYKGRNVGRTIVALGANPALLADVMSQGPNGFGMKEGYINGEPAFDKNLTREDFPSRQAWRAYCRELAKRHSKGK